MSSWIGSTVQNKKNWYAKFSTIYSIILKTRKEKFQWRHLGNNWPTTGYYSHTVKIPNFIFFRIFCFICIEILILRIFAFRMRLFVVSCVNLSSNFNEFTLLKHFNKMCLNWKNTKREKINWNSRILFVSLLLYFNIYLHCNISYVIFIT